MDDFVDFDAALGTIAGAGASRSMFEARDEAEARYLVPPPQAAVAAAADGDAGFGNIVGIGLGEKEVGGAPAGRLAVKVFVRRKLRRSRIASGALVPRALGGIATDVDALGDVGAQGFLSRARPAPGGMSIGRCDWVMAGSSACLVTRSRRLYLLGTNHILALVNRGPGGAGLHQPGPCDGGADRGDLIARLSRFVPISFDGPNDVDAAVARTSPALVDRRVLRSRGARVALARPEVAPALRLRVQKCGRTTRHRRGVIDAVAVSVNVSYAPLGGTARFTSQFRVRGIRGPFSDRGDSGALVTTDPGNQPVGLLFCGSAAANVSFCNDIRTVCRRLAVSIAY